MKERADSQLYELQKEIKYDTKDYTVEVILSKLDKNEIIIPDYQRNFIWKSKDKASFIESVLLGLPIPFMFFCEREDGNYEIIDGAQRVQTLMGFRNGDMAISDIPKLTALEGFKFSDLSTMHQRRFLNKTLRIIVLDSTTQSDVCQDIFNRINASGIKINDSEMRRGSYPGKFTKFIDECSNDELFIKLCPVPDKKAMRYERFELVLRFFAYLNEYENFEHRVSSFLDSFLKRKQNSFDEQKYLNEFNKTMLFVREYFPNGFAKTLNASSTPRVRFEAIAVGTALALRENSDLSVRSVEWLESDKFRQLTTSDASNNQGELKKRVEFVRDHLLKDIV
jgi:uncharacterized protein with ParB-like and HNH nuclease domain